MCQDLLQAWRCEGNDHQGILPTASLSVAEGVNGKGWNRYGQSGITGLERKKEY